MYRSRSLHVYPHHSEQSLMTYTSWQNEASTQGKEAQFLQEEKGQVPIVCNFFPPVQNSAKQLAVHTAECTLVLSTPGSCQRCVFSWKGRIFYYEVFSRMYLPLALEVYNGLFIDMLGFMALDIIKKHLRFTQSKYLTLCFQ